jgi:hyperosmotically inducible protein
MNRFTLTTIAAAIALAFSAGATAAPEAAKEEAKVTKEKPATAAVKKESAGEYVDDSVITGKVKAAVLGESSLKSAEINVETYKGVVQLSGFVGSRAAINKAVELAHAVKGVSAVKNDMVVKGQQ